MFSSPIARHATLAKAVSAGLFSLCLGAAAWAQSPTSQMAYAPANPRAVGEITLAVGPVVKTSAEGMPETVQRGSPVLPGDRLDTADGGMVHVRFIDGALVSLRPGSRLWVEDYRYDPGQIAKSMVRFRLDRGVARAISGAAAEGAKERFRLNTPLVAIGVRGTDFVVRTSNEATSAAVNQGAIVMAPFDAGCLAQALGPCTSPGAKLLSADMGHLMVEFRPQLKTPEIRPAQTMTAMRAEPADGSAGGSGAGIASGPARAATPDADEATAAGLVRDLVRTASAPTGSTSVPIAEVTPPAPPDLIWGRWAEGASFAADISVPRSQARAGREPTVGDDQYGLYRIESGATLNPGLGAYDFALQQSQAQFNIAGQAMAAAVASGQLSIDFANRNFSTSLSVSSVPTGVVAITGAGFLRDDGVFVDRVTPGTAIAGAAALDGKTAGYLFEKAAAGGTLTGITLWSRK
jgi:hypothetical protein